MENVEKNVEFCQPGNVGTLGYQTQRKLNILSVDLLRKRS